MEILDEYTNTLYPVPPEEEALVLQLTQRGATVREIVDVLQLPAPEAEPEKVHGYLPASDGGVIPIEEVEELK